MKIDLLCQYSQENHQKMFENARRHAFLDILVDFFIPKWLKNVPKCMRACIFLIFGSTYCDQPSLWSYLYCAVWKYEVKPKCTTQSLCFIWLVWLALLLFPNSFKSREVFVKRSRILPARADAEWGWFRSPPFPNLFKSNPLFKSRSRFLFDGFRNSQLLIFKQHTCLICICQNNQNIQNAHHIFLWNLHPSRWIRICESMLLIFRNVRM